MKNKLFKVFHGRYVSVITKSIRGSQMIEEGVVAEGNVIIEGFLLDEDDEYYYFGKQEDKIDDSLLREDIVRMYESSSEIDNVFKMIDVADGEH